MPIPKTGVALLAFLVTAVIASHLSASAKKQALIRFAASMNGETYALSRNLLLPDTRGPSPSRWPTRSRRFRAPGVAFFDRSSDRIHRAGPQDIPVDDTKLRDAALQGTVFHDAVAHITVMPISLGGQPMGAWGSRERRFPRRALHAIANLAAIALERARALETATRAEAARQSEELKSTMLDAWRTS